MNRKWIALIAIMMMVLLFGACASSDMQPEGEDQVTEAVTETTEAETEDIVEEDEIFEEEIVDTEESSAVEEEAQTQPDAEQSGEDASSEIDLSVVCTQMTSQLGISDAFVLDTASLMGLYGIGADAVKQSGGFVTMSGTFPDEIVMVEAVDEASADVVQACLQARLDAVMVQSQTYDAENYAAAQSCSVRRNGNFVCLILSPKQAELADVYSAYIG